MYEADGCTVRTTAGPVRGYRDQAILVFKGIPYGASPEGEGRFRPAKPPKPWTDVLNAHHFGPASPQAPLPSQVTLAKVRRHNPNFLEVYGLEGLHPLQDEDCLYLNVWTPAVNDGKRRAVMVRLHGGGHWAGAGSYSWLDGANLAAHGDVVVVTLNHRLGPFGYLFLGDIDPAYAEGNVGTTDLVLALQWVRDNIEAFGGDPDRVTISGESGGAHKTSVLLGFPAAQGLFHRAIMESGAHLDAIPREEAAAAARRLLAKLEIGAHELHKLKDVPVDALFIALAATGGANAPMVDGVTLPDHPGAIVASGMSADIPVIVGSNMTEGTMLRDAALHRAMTIGMEELKASLTQQFGAEADTLLQAYSAEFPKASPGLLFFLIESGSTFRRGAINFAENKLKAAKAPVYVYQLEWMSPARDGMVGAAHGLEVPMVMNNMDRGGRWTADYAESRTVGAAMRDAWLAFAKTGDPNAEGLTPWPAYRDPKRATMLFDLESRIENDAHGERELWARIASPGGFLPLLNSTPKFGDVRLAPA